MAAIPVVTPVIGGSVTAATAATAGPDTIAPAGRPVHLFVDNNNAGAVTLAIVVPGNTRFGQPEPDITSVSITAGAHAVFRLPAELADPTTRLISVTATPSASVSFFAVRA